MGRIRDLLNRLFYAIGANVISLIVSVMTTFFIPKFLGEKVEQYGYYQIYIFYTGYIGFFHLGWSDGIILRDGGKRYEDLDKPLYSSQFWLLTLFEGFVSAGILISGLIFSANQDYLFIFFAVALTVLIYLPRTQLTYYLQATNRIKEYAVITALCRLLFGISIILIVLFGKPDYKLFILGDLCGKLIALLVSMWICKDIVKTRPVILSVAIKEAIANITVGCKLLFANIASLLVTGIVRWGIQINWDVVTYAKISFTLSVSNLFLAFISAVAVVLYPTLRRTNEERLPYIYGSLRNMLMMPILACLILYYPIMMILSKWLPQYTDGIRYMAILFPLCIYSAKMNMLVQTYLKVFRLEKHILRINIIGLILAAFSTAVCVFLLNNLTVSMISIVVNQMICCIYAEIILSKHINIRVLKDIIFEIILTAVFIISSWFIGGWFGVGIYTIVYVAYVVCKIPEVKKLIEISRSFIENRRINQEGGYL